MTLFEQLTMLPQAFSVVKQEERRMIAACRALERLQERARERPCLRPALLDMQIRVRQMQKQHRERLLFCFVSRVMLKETLQGRFLPEEWAVLYGLYFQNQSEQEVAASLGCAKRTVQRRRARALSRLERMQPPAAC